MGTGVLMILYMHIYEKKNFNNLGEIELKKMDSFHGIWNNFQSNFHNCFSLVKFTGPLRNSTGQGY